MNMAWVLKVSNMFSAGFGVQWVVSQQHWMLLKGYTQLVVEYMVSHLRHECTSWWLCHKVVQGKDAMLALDLLPHAHHVTLGTPTIDGNMNFCHHHQESQIYICQSQCQWWATWFLLALWSKETGSRGAWGQRHRNMGECLQETPQVYVHCVFIVYNFSWWFLFVVTLFQIVLNFHIDRILFP